jgi:branched-chain amino acid transport system ATP-binding protein
MSLLQIRSLEASYGASQALFGVDLDVGEGETVALLGRNGMGKTTTIRAVFGMVPASSGTIRFDGQDIRRAASHAIARKGLGLVPEGRRCFPNLTVAENMLVVARPGRWTPARIGALFPRLQERAGQLARTLSGGEQQMLAIGRALATNPRLLVLDEATEGLAPVIRQDIWRALRVLKSEGQSILVVDKILGELLPAADRCTVLENGRSVWSGPAQDLSREVRDRYLGV